MCNPSQFSLIITFTPSFFTEHFNFALLCTPPSHKYFFPWGFQTKSLQVVPNGVPWWTVNQKHGRKILKEDSVLQQFSVKIGTELLKAKCLDSHICNNLKNSFLYLAYNLWLWSAFRLCFEWGSTNVFWVMVLDEIYAIHFVVWISRNLTTRKWYRFYSVYCLHFNIHREDSDIENPRLRYLGRRLHFCIYAVIEGVRWEFWGENFVPRERKKEGGWRILQ
jgi:hypothetical protein